MLGDEGFLQSNHKDEEILEFLPPIIGNPENNPLYIKARSILEGRFTINDEAETADCYKFLAAIGNAEAQYRLGLLYQEGRGVPKDHAKALKLFERAARKNHLDAQLKLANLYFHRGEGKVNIDQQELIQMLHAIAEKGNPDVQFELGNIYAAGKGIDKNISKAMIWFEKAAENGHKSAKEYISKLAEDGFEDALKWLQKNAEKGLTDLQYNLGMLYCKKGFVSVGMGWIKKAAEKGYLPAIEWLIKNADDRRPDAQYALGKIFCLGRGVKADLHKAKEWLKKASEKGHKESAFLLTALSFDFEKIESLELYYPQRLHRDDFYSKQILALKDKDNQAIEYFVKLFLKKFGSLKNNPFIAICCVPSHEPGNINGIKIVAKRAAVALNITDATECLERITRVAKLSKGGTRSVNVHLDSIQLNNKSLLENKVALLVDDVSTTGNSLKACEMIIKKNSEALQVMKVSLAQTVSCWRVWCSPKRTTEEHNPFIF
ncbi:MAG: hypothetical protein QXH80_04105 [Candidatus Nanoarchaeia archaeon]